MIGAIFGVSLIVAVVALLVVIFRSISRTDDYLGLWS